MKIAIVSDTHSRSTKIQQALALIAARGIELILHCGDIEDDDAVLLFPVHTHFVFGNCDHDREGIRSAVQSIGARLHEGFGHLEIDGKTLGFVHGDDRRLLDELIQSEGFDYLFYGHTHIAKDERIGPTRVINPGALHRARPKTFVILDVTTGDIEPVEV